MPKAFALIEGYPPEVILEEAGAYGDPHCKDRI
jgi:hypothetical protein